MGLKDAVRGKLEQWALNYFIAGIESGRYGDRAKSIWFSLKGKKSIIGWSIFAIGGAIALWPSPETLAFGSAVAVAGSYLGRLGLAAKGADRSAPPFPEEYRGAAEFALSAFTYVVEIATAVAGLMMLSGSARATTASLTLLLFAQGLSTATAYFATLIGATPASRGGQA